MSKDGKKAAIVATVSLAAGALAGAALGVLFAPRRGTDTRARLRFAADDAARRTKDAACAALTKGRQSVCDAAAAGGTAVRNRLTAAAEKLK